MSDKGLKMGKRAVIGVLVFFAARQILVWRLNFRFFVRFFQFLS